MNWTRKKSALTRVFPVSWFSRSKQKGGNLDSNSMKNKQKCLSEFPTPKSSGWKEGRFYSMDEDDAYWRISFGEERIQGRRSTGGINPLWYDSDHEFKIPVSGFQSVGLTEMEVPRRDEYRNFSEMVSDIKRMKERRGRQRTMAENGGFRDKTGGTGEAGLSTQRRKHVNDQVSRKGVDDGGEKISDPGERDIFPVEPENMVQKRDDSWKSAVSNSRKQRKNPNIGISSVKEDHEIANPERVSVSEWQNLKLKEIKIKPEPEKKWSRKLKENSRGMKAYSPRTECKIRALEEMKKARMKSKKKERKEQVSDKNSIFDSFAVVKSSYDPQQDFRDSMVEMIREKGIGHPEELEELLACYLTLNCDEYHDLIIKVFRQVWLELKGMYIDPPIQNGPYFDC